MGEQRTLSQLRVALNDVGAGRMSAQLALETAEEARQCAWSALRDFLDEDLLVTETQDVAQRQLQIQLLRLGHVFDEITAGLAEIAQGAQRIAALPLVDARAVPRARKREGAVA